MMTMGPIQIEVMEKKLKAIGIIGVILGYNMGIILRNLKSASAG